MAYTTSTIPAVETTPFAADVTLMGANMIPIAPTVRRWVLSGTTTGSDITLSTNPASRAYDGKTHVDTRPNTTIATHVTAGVGLAFDLVAAGVQCDFVAIMGTNFGSMDASFTCKAQIADNSAFSSNLITLATFTNTNDRQIDFTLNGGNNRYGAVRYFRLFCNATAGGAYTPAIGEVILGRRCQLVNNPLRPYDTTGLGSAVDVFASRSGVVSRVVKFRGARRVEATINPVTTASAADVLLWYQNTNHGTRPFVWCQNPSTAPATYHYMVPSTDLNMPFQGPLERSFHLSAIEQGPDYLELE